MPSIVAALFIYSLMITILGFGRSAVAVSLALVLLMLPTVLRSTEEMLKLVPDSLREAAYALGVPKWKTILKVVIPTAFGGISTGVVLGLARVMGETAPLLILVSYAVGINFSPTADTMAALPTMINSGRDQAPQLPGYERVWAAALTLILIVMLLNLLARGIARASSSRRSRHLMAKRIDVKQRQHLLRRLPRRRGRVADRRAPYGDRVHRPVRLRQVDRAADPEPDARGDPRRPRQGQRRAGRHRPVRGRCRSGRRPPRGGHGVPATEPVPVDVDLRQRRLRPAAERGQEQERLADAVERSLVAANLWNEVKDRLGRAGIGLSGGQQQRLCIARAIAVEPQVLLMDEPCSALDPISTLAIEDLIGELKEQYTVVIVTHNMQQAARVSDQTAFFNLAAQGKPGRLIEIGSTEKIFSNPGEKATEDYITGRFG